MKKPVRAKRQQPSLVQAHDGPGQKGLLNRAAFLACLLVLTGLSLPTKVFAAGQLMVAPTRIVFEGRQRTAHVNLVNTGDATATYRISLVQRRMTDTGEFLVVDEALPGEMFLDGMVRFAPRLVELPPGKGQTIRLMLRKKADLAEGEYRSHLLFRALPPAADKSIEALQSGNEQQLTIQLMPVIGITIPVIMRHGQTEAAISFADLNLGRESPSQDAPLVLHMNMLRTGNRSTYGDLVVFFTPRDGKEKVVAQANGVAVYTPNAKRHVRLRLQPSQGTSLSDGRLRVVYRAPQADGGSILAEATLDIR